MDSDRQARSREIIRVNTLGIGMNLLLTAAKLSIGYLANAHAVMLDGINSLSDLLSALLNIVCTRIGAQKADSTHPFGYGRLEYLSSLAVTLMIMYVGGKSLLETVEDILDPHEAPRYSLVVAGVMLLSLLLKLAYGLYARRRGKALRSGALVMSGTDSLGDAVIAASVLAAIVIYRLFAVDIEHYLCIGIALMILKTGYEVMRDCMRKILGGAIDPEYRRKISTLLAEENEVLNVTNLIVHNYGEGVQIGSADIEVRADMRAAEISELTRRLKRRAAEEGLTLSSVGINAVNTESREAAAVWDGVIETALDCKAVRKVQAFSYDAAQKRACFDVVLDYHGEKEGLNSFREALQQRFPDTEFQIQIALNMGGEDQAARSSAR